MVGSRSRFDRFDSIGRDDRAFLVLRAPLLGRLHFCDAIRAELLGVLPSGQYRPSSLASQRNCRLGMDFLDPRLRGSDRFVLHVRTQQRILLWNRIVDDRNRPCRHSFETCMRPNNSFGPPRFPLAIPDTSLASRRLAQIRLHRPATIRQGGVSIPCGRRHAGRPDPEPSASMAITGAP